MWRRRCRKRPSRAAIEAAAVPPARATRGYPEPFAALVAGRERRALGGAFWLTNFGGHLTLLRPAGLWALRPTPLREGEHLYTVAGGPRLLTTPWRTPRRARE